MDLALPVAIAAALLVIVVRSIHAIPQSQVAIVERLGTYSRALEPGLHFVTPFTCAVVARVSLQPSEVELPIRWLVTQDDARVEPVLSVRYVVTDPVRVYYDELHDTLAQHAERHLEELLRSRTQADARAHRNGIAMDLRRALQQPAADAGVRLEDVLVTSLEQQVEPGGSTTQR